MADRDGRVQKGDRVLSINGKGLKGVTHREALSILKVLHSYSAAAPQYHQMMDGTSRAWADVLFTRRPRTRDPHRFRPHEKNLTFFPFCHHRFFVLTRKLSRVIFMPDHTLHGPESAGLARATRSVSIRSHREYISGAQQVVVVQQKQCRRINFQSRRRRLFFFAECQGERKKNGICEA